MRIMTVLCSGVGAGDTCVSKKLVYSLNFVCCKSALKVYIFSGAVGECPPLTIEKILFFWNLSPSETSWPVTEVTGKS